MKKQTWNLILGICLVFSLSSLVFIVVGCGTGVDELPTTTISVGTTTTVAGGTTTTVAGATTTTTTTTTTWPDFNWTLKKANPFTKGRYNHTCLVYKGEIWVIGGRTSSGGTGEVWHSSDGENWACATVEAGFKAAYEHTSVVFDAQDGAGDKMWVIGGKMTAGATSEVWSSSDGVVWMLVTNEAAFGTRSGHNSLVYDNKMWVISGIENGTASKSVYYSSNGRQWTLATNNASFGSREYMSGVVHDGKMWIMGGILEGGSKYYAMDDSWYSTNGADWYRVGNIKAASSQIATSETARMIAPAVVFPVNGVDYMFITGGASFTPDGHDMYKNDTWLSANGSSWTQTASLGAVTAYPTREGHTAVVFNNKIWVIGGDHGDPYNDIWYMPKP